MVLGRFSRQPGNESMRRPLLLFVVNDVGYFITHRLPLAEAARYQGYDVQIACTGDGARLRAMGFVHHQCPSSRHGNPLGEFRALVS